MSGVLSSEERERFARDGLLFPIPVFSTEEVRQYASACDELERLLGGRPRTVEVRQMHLHFRWAFELATHPHLLDSIEDLLEANLLIWATELFVKHPQDEAISIGWHRDAPYIGVEPSQVVTAWVALSESCAANGCMRALRRTTGRDRAPREEASNCSKQASVPSATVEIAETDAVDVVLRPGEVSFHAADIVHGSSANRSDRKRVGMVVRYVSARARPKHGRPPVLVARGHAEDCSFEVLEPPRPATVEESLTALKASAARHLSVVLENLQHAAK